MEVIPVTSEQVTLTDDLGQRFQNFLGSRPSQWLCDCITAPLGQEKYNTFLFIEQLGRNNLITIASRTLEVCVSLVNLKYAAAHNFGNGGLGASEKRTVMWPRQELKDSSVTKPRYCTELLISFQLGERKIFFLQINQYNELHYTHSYIAVQLTWP